MGKISGVLTKMGKNKQTQLLITYYFCQSLGDLSSGLYNILVAKMMKLNKENEDFFFFFFFFLFNPKIVFFFFFFFFFCLSNIFLIFRNNKKKKKNIFFWGVGGGGGWRWGDMTLGVWLVLGLHL